MNTPVQNLGLINFSNFHLLLVLEDGFWPFGKFLIFPASLDLSPWYPCMNLYSSIEFEH